MKLQYSFGVDVYVSIVEIYVSETGRVVMMKGTVKAKGSAENV